MKGYRFALSVVMILIVPIATGVTINLYNKRYKETHRKGSYVTCDIGVGDSMRGIVLEEDDDRIYIKGERQCLMYCRNAPYGDTDQLDEMGVTEEYKERYPADDVKYKDECYRKNNNKDKMHAIIEWYEG